MSASVVATVPVGVAPNDVAVDPSAHAAYVANRASGSVSVVGGSPSRVLATVPIGPAPPPTATGPSSVAVDPALHRAYSATAAIGSVVVLDTTTDAVVGHIPTGSSPQVVAVDPTTHTLYVGDDGDAEVVSRLGVHIGTVRDVDGATGRVRISTALSASPLAAALTEIHGLAVDPSARVVYVAANRKDELWVARLDGATLAARGAAGLPGLPFGVAVDAPTRRVCATDPEARAASPVGGLIVLDGTNQRTFTQRPVYVHVGDNPLGVAVDPTTQTVYVANSGSGTLGGSNSDSVSVLDGNTNQLLATVPVGKTPWAVAVDPTTHLVYVTNQDSNTVTVIQGPTRPTSVPHDARYSPQTGYRIDDDAIWNYFNRRGGLPTFGYPTSRTSTFQGFAVQLFQRRVVQLAPDGSARQLNLLDPGLLPYTSFNGSTFPGVDSALVGPAPDPTDQPATLAFVRQHAPDSYHGAPVGFHRTFIDTVTPQVAFPNGGDPALVPGIALEMWGVPTGGPLVDPTNHTFISLRWQRGIMLHDESRRVTEGILLADELKAILTGQDLPPDVDRESRQGPFYQQVDPGRPNWVRDPGLLPDTDLTDAFAQE